MRIATIKEQGREVAAIRTGTGYVSLEAVNEQLDKGFPTDLRVLLNPEHFEPLKEWYKGKGREALEGIPAERNVDFGPLCRNPGLIWGIGLNYREHARDLSETVPEAYPGTFIKSATTVIGPGDTIEIPQLSERTTAEAELGLVIGRTCKDVPRENWLDVIAGFTTIIDMTAEDILRLNPRYLTLCKNFDTFFSFGPELVTPDEVADAMDLKVSTMINGRIHAENVVSAMTFPPDALVAILSRVKTLHPGDVISTGTPGAVLISEGDVVSCRIDDFEPLINPVRDLKKG